MHRLHFSWGQYIHSHQVLNTCVKAAIGPVEYCGRGAVQGGLGLSGVEGVFRTACQTALSVLRGGSASLTALLAAIVHDPLVDWGAEVEGAAAKKVYPYLLALLFRPLPCQILGRQ